MKITALSENTSRDPQIGCEHGLSLYIETGKHHILFDSGQSGLFAENAAKLGVELSAVDFAVLSHGHYDHGGGLRRFLEINPTAPVYLSRHAFEPHFNASDKDIGLDTGLQNCDRLIFTGETHRITEGITLHACNNRKIPFKTDSAGLKSVQKGVLIPEDFRHEHYLLIEENDKRTLISGCSHKGILNIMEWFKPDVLVGGFHFMKRPLDATLIKDAKRLDSFSASYYTCHCTGVEQYAFMQPHIKRLHYLSAGETIIV